MRLPFAAIACLCLALFASTTFAQPKKAKPAAAAAEDVDAEAAQQRTVAISLVSSLADEARSFKDQTRRARVQARAADVLWTPTPNAPANSSSAPGKRPKLSTPKPQRNAPTR